MKKLVLFVFAAVAAASCSAPARLVNTSASSNSVTVFQPTAVVADVKVSETKITYLYIPTSTVKNGGETNVIDTAVREAVASAGDFDVLVAKDTQIKYASDGSIESVLVTGYPGKYVNWRSSDAPVAAPEKPASAVSLPSFGKRK